MEFGTDYIVIEEDSNEEVKFELEPEDSEEKVAIKQISAIKYICLLKESSRILNSVRSIKALEFLNSTYLPGLTTFEELSDDLQRLFVDVILEFLKRHQECINENLKKYDYYNKTLDSSKNQSLYYLELRMNYLEAFLRLLYVLSSRSNDFCAKFHDAKGLRTLMPYLSNTFFIAKLVESADKPHGSAFSALKALMECILGTIDNLSCLADKYKQDWIETKAFDCLVKIAQSVGAVSDFRCTAHLIMATLFNEKHLNKLSDIKLAIVDIVNLVAECAMKIQNKNLARASFKINNELGQKETPVVHCMIGENAWHLIKLLKSLFHLAVNDAIKYDMYETYAMKDYLRLVIYHGNDVEREYAAKLLWQFCFDERIVKNVGEDAKLQAFISTLLQQELLNANLRQDLEGIVWCLNKKGSVPLKPETRREKFLKWLKEKGSADGPTPGAKKLLNSANTNEHASGEDLSATESSSLDDEEYDVDDKHIMISYNRDSRDLCLSIKQELEQLGFRVWIDIENIRGSSLESMAQAIENSECVLICMTEKYKQSPNCRAEAEYAFQLKKPFVPLIMQQNYKPDGWLGILLGSKIFVDFTKYPFEECIVRLKRELLGIYGKCLLLNKPKSKLVEDLKLRDGTSSSNRSSMVSSIVTLPEQASPFDWTETEVAQWLTEKNFHATVVDNVKPADGKLLHQMLLMFQSAPEAFYASLNKSAKASLRDLVIFSTELKLLFDSP